MNTADKKIELSIVIPTYNERKNVSILIPQIVDLFNRRGIVFEILVVDDSSPDGTQEVILKMKKEFKNIHLISRKKKEGIGAALKEGYNLSLGKYILSSDADLSFKVSDMGKLYDKINEGYDLVVGSRYAKGGYYERKNIRTFSKNMVSSIGNRLWGFLFGFPTSDFSANFRIIRNKTWKEIETKENTNFLLFEMVYKTYLKSKRITEIPVSFVDRKYGESKLNLSIEAPKAAGKLLVYLLKYRLSKHG